MRYFGITSPDINNGLGFRVSIWVSGCTCNCPGCHNPETHDFMAGKEWTEESWDELTKYLSKPYISGVTFTGGNPVESPQGILEIMERIKKEYPTKNIWVYSGFTLDELRAKEETQKLLPYIDYLVDGRFILSKRNTTIAFRGSTNQTIWKNTGEGYFKKIDIDGSTVIEL